MNNIMGSAPTIERGRRCQNCVHFSNDEEIAIKRYKELRFRDMQRHAAEVLERDGVSPKRIRKMLENVQRHKPGTPAPHRIQRQGDVDPHSKLAENYTLGDNLIRQGLLGICLQDCADGDFVHAHYLCDRWTEKYRPDGAEKPDELPEDARARLGLQDKE